MATPTSPNLEVVHLLTSVQDKTTPANAALDKLDKAIAGYAAVDFASDADLDNSSGTGKTTMLEGFYFDVTSSVSLTATRNLVVPDNTKPYAVANNTTGGQSITVKTSAGTGITIANGNTQILFCDGTNVVALAAAV